MDISLQSSSMFAYGARAAREAEGSHPSGPIAIRRQVLVEVPGQRT